MASRLLEKYKAEIKPVLEAEFPKNKTLTAKIDKVVISVGAGEAMKDTKLIQNMQDTISLIAGQRAVKVIVRVSKPGRRVYKPASEIKNFKNGYGTIILSTNKGIIANDEAFAANVGGEVLCTVW